MKAHRALPVRTLGRLLLRMGSQKYFYVLICMMGILMAGLDMIPARLVGNAINIMSAGPFTMTQVASIVALWALVAFANQLLHGAQIFIATKTGERVLAKLREELFSHLQKLSLRFFDRNHLGRILAAFGSDLDSLHGLAVWGPNTITSNLAFLTFSAVMIARTDVHMFMAVAWLAPFMTLLNFFYGKKLSESWQKLRHDLAALSGNQAENIAGARVVAAFNRQQDNLVSFNELQDLNAINHMTVSRQNGTFQPALQWIRFLGQAIVLLYGGYRVVSGQMRTGDLVAVSLYWEWFMMPATNFGAFFNDLIISSSGAERVISLLDEKPEVEDLPEARDLQPLEGRVKMENVHFSYLEGHPVLKGVSFEVPAGTTVALVGSTGSGKSTLISLLARFYLPQRGRVLFDEQDTRTATSESLHRQIALVLQANFLFHGTIRENLRYDRPLVSDDEIDLAMHALGCHESLIGLKEGYDTEVGEAGAALSLGERQLVCFARALLRNPRVLLLDEATSALDPVMDGQVRRALRKLTRSRTTFIVTHRLNTALEADVVLMMENGAIVEQGSHDELVARGGAYARLYQDSLNAVGETDAEPIFDAVTQSREPLEESV